MKKIKDIADKTLTVNRQRTVHDDSSLDFTAHLKSQLPKINLLTQNRFLRITDEFHQCIWVEPGDINIMQDREQ